MVKGPTQGHRVRDNLQASLLGSAVMPSPSFPATLQPTPCPRTVMSDPCDSVNSLSPAASHNPLPLSASSKASQSGPDAHQPLTPVPSALPNA